MPTYLQPVETDSLALPSSPEFHVTMKRKATYGDQSAAQAVMIQVDQAGANLSPKMDWGAYMRALTVRMVVAWDLSDEAGHPLPISAASFDRLNLEDGEFLVAEAQKRLGMRSPERERDFAQPSSDSSADTK